jgi:hypothetical protein
MLVNLERAIKSIDGEIGLLQPLFEGIINAFQANADEIKIKFEIDNNNIVGYSINDNGDGFTNDRIKSFLTLWSDYNITKGALGSGRILCLKVFDNMIIKSQTKNVSNEYGQEVNINFNRNFKANSIEDINPIKNTSENSHTTTIFTNINKEYIQKNNIKYDKKFIEDKIFIELLPMFIKFKDIRQIFSIEIDGVLFLDTDTLENKFNESDFKNKSFDIEVDLSQFEKEYNDLKNMETHTFDLNYRITKDGEKILEQFYGASDRNITNFPKGIRFNNLESGYSGVFCLTSKYFEDRVKDSRNEFVIRMGDNNSKSKSNPITFPEINKQLLLKMNELLKEEFSEIEKKLEEKKLNVVKEFPHLEQYIKKIDNLTMSELEILNEAEKEFIKETKKARKDVVDFTKRIKDNKKFDEEKYQKITNNFTIAGREQLANYIGYRQTIIDMLVEIDKKTAKDMRTFKEEDIHNLFMPIGSTNDTLFSYANNAWIFDDKFMSYNYVASDTTIAKIVNDVIGKDKSEIPDNHKNQRPDLVMFYSNPENENKDILLIEFKRLNNVISEKKKAITQLQDYPMYIRKNIENVRSIFSYTIIDIDEPFSEWLTDSQDFAKNAFGDKDDNISAYYRYYPKVQSHVNVVSFSQILQDADKRNKVFLDILIKNFKNDSNNYEEINCE